MNNKKNILTAFVFVYLIPVFLWGQQQVRLPIGGINMQVHAPSVTDSANHFFRFEHHINIKKIDEGVFYVKIDILPNQAYRPGCIDIPLTIELGSQAEMEAAKKWFHWIPNIKRTPDEIVSQHVFRSPCIIHMLRNEAFAFIPDINEMKNNAIAPYYFDLNYTGKTIHINYGISNYDVARHQYYRKSNKLFALDGKIDLAFYILISPGTSTVKVLKTTNHFLWSHFAKTYTQSYLPQTLRFNRYAEVGYSMALKNYWVEAGEPGKGGITLSTYYDETTKKYGGRFYKNDLWYHSWFNNARTAYGLFYWGRELNHEDWKVKALAAFKLILESPNDGGWFPTIYLSEKNQWLSSGQGGGKEVYHMPDNVWTAYWIMRFNDEMQRMKGADSFLLNFSNALLQTQNRDGSFPSRIRVKTYEADSVLRFSASSSMATWYLQEMLLKNKIGASSIGQYKKAILRSLNFLDRYVLPNQRFEDFELYFSCSAKPMHYFDSTTNLYGQNTLSIQWCAEAYLAAYRLFKDVKYLKQGEYCLNILGLYQQVWNPPFINLYAFGGFGVQNTDAEWNDARQAQFAETYLNYYFATGNSDYLERCVYACRSAFALMVIPENKNICPENYQGTESNGESFTGSMAENYGHSGYNSRSYQSGFHWGTGSALTTAAILKNKLGDIYIGNGIAMGIDGIVVKKMNIANNEIQLTTKRLHKDDVTIVTDGIVKENIVIDDSTKGFHIRKRWINKTAGYK